MRLPYWLKCKTKDRWGDHAVDIVDWALDELLRLELFDTALDMPFEGPTTFKHYEHAYWASLVAKYGVDGVTELSKLSGCARETVYRKLKEYRLVKEVERLTDERRDNKIRAKLKREADDNANADET